MKKDFHVNPSRFYDVSLLQKVHPHDFVRKSFQERKININYIDGPFVEILDSNESEYSVEFYDASTEELVHKSVISQNCWSRASRQWYTDWKIIVRDHRSGETVHESRLDLRGKRVFICFESSSLGDTLAWIPYAEEFRKKHNCKVLVSTFHNYLFKDAYSEIEFLERGISADNVIATYRLGWFYHQDSEDFDVHRNPQDPKSQEMQKTASDILGLEYRQIRPCIYKPNMPSTIEGKYVCIGIHSTSQAKYWNYQNGWQEIVDHLNSEGYKVVLITKESGTYMGNVPPMGIIDKTAIYPLIDRINDLQHAEFYIGLGSGLSWLAWAVKTPVVLISGFSEPMTEFQCLFSWHSNFECFTNLSQLLKKKLSSSVMRACKIRAIG